MKSLVLACLFTAACGTTTPPGEVAPDASAPDADPAGPSTTGPTMPMPLISRGVPAFSSGGAGASAANDADPASSWSSSTLPAWLAYDLSAVPMAQRQRALVSFYAPHAPCYLDEGGSSGDHPVDYTIEASTAPGGGAPPVDGWRSLVTVSGGSYCNRQHVVDLAGASWVRVRVTRGSSGVAIDLDVHAAPSGASDAWLFMGDSITYMSLTYAFSDLPALVRARRADAWPAVLDAAIGGTNTGTALEAIDATMRDFPGRYVVLAYGTNDHASEFPAQMEALVQKVIAAGKSPVIPHMPWSSGSTEGVAINAAIDALYAHHPEIVRGPDLWAFFTGRTDLIPVGDVHPNGPGQAALRAQWAEVIAGLYP